MKVLKEVYQFSNNGNLFLLILSSYNSQVDCSNNTCSLISLFWFDPVIQTRVGGRADLGMFFILYFSFGVYFVTHHWNCLFEMVLMSGRGVHYRWGKGIVFGLSSTPPPPSHLELRTFFFFFFVFQFHLCHFMFFNRKLKMFIEFCYDFNLV